MIPAASHQPGRTAIGRGHLLAIGAIVLLGAILRIALADYSLWYDELASIFFADRKIETLWSSWMVRETNPPLYYSMLRGWIAAFGHSIISLRLLSILGGMLGIALLICYSLRSHGPRTALAVAMLACLSAHHIYFSHQLRGYIFAVDSILISLVGLHMLAQGTSYRSRGAALYIVGAVLAIYFHTTMFLWPIVATLSFVAVFWRDLFAGRMRLLLWLLAANLLILAGSAWWLAMTVRHLDVSHGNIDWIEPLTINGYQSTLASTILLLRGGQGWERVLPYFMAAGAIGGALTTWKNPATRFCTVAAILSVLVFGMAGSLRPIVHERTIFWITIFPLLLVGALIGSIRRDGLRYAVLGAVAAVLVFNLVRARPHFAIEEWSGALRTVARTPGAVLVVEGESMGVLAGYACRVEFHAQASCPVRIVAVASPAPTSGVWARGMFGQRLLPVMELGSVLAPTARVYLLSRGQYQPLRSIQAAGYLPRVPVGEGNLTGPFGPAQLPGGKQN